jgi:hypothetical protein
MYCITLIIPIVCLGNKDCADNTDELSCCPKDKFRCAVSGECLDASRLCDGVNDCADSSDELVPQCSAEAQVGPGRVPGTTDTKSLTGTGATITYVVVALSIVVVVIILLVGYIWWKRRFAEKPDKDVTGAVIANRDFPLMSRGPAVGAENSGMQRLNSAAHLAMPTSSRDMDGIVSHVDGSSNGVGYDRNRLTGASSSDTTASSGFRPTTPNTAVAARHTDTLPAMTSSRYPAASLQHRATASMPRRPYFSGSLMRPTARAPPLHPTPASTDVNDSDVNSVFTPDRPHYTSVANSVVGFDGDVYSDYLDHEGYGDDVVDAVIHRGVPGGGRAAAATRRPDSPANEGTFFLNDVDDSEHPPPPPSPCRAPTPAGD